MRKSTIHGIVIAALLIILAVPLSHGQTAEHTAGGTGITIWTDDFYKDRQSTITIHGHTIYSAPVTILVVNPTGNIAAFGQTDPEQDGTFSINLQISGTYWRHDGIYTITARAGADTAPYTIHIAVGDTDCDGIHLDAGTDGVYCIPANNITKLYLDKDQKSITIHGDGHITMQIPRSVLDAKNSGIDIPFVIYHNDVIVRHMEDSHNTTRTIQFEHPGGAVTLQGTHAIPEFGGMILVMAICIMIMISYGYVRYNRIFIYN